MCELKPFLHQNLALFLIDFPVAAILEETTYHSSLHAQLLCLTLLVGSLRMTSSMFVCEMLSENGNSSSI